MTTKQTFFVIVDDTCSYNSSPAQKELVLKPNFRTDGSEKLLLKTGQQLLKDMSEERSTQSQATTSSHHEEEEYYYTWSYVHPATGEITSGYIHIYISQEIKGEEIVRCQDWIYEVLSKLAREKGLELNSLKKDKRCEYMMKFSYRKI